MKQRPWRIWFSALFILTSLACNLVTGAPPSQLTDTPTASTAASPTLPSLPTLEGVIAYSSEREGIWQIIAMNANGGDETSLTAEGAYSRPAWSPNGQQIAMRMDITMGSGIAVTDVRRENGRLTGTAPKTILEAFADGPRWSPDGTQLVYVASEGSGGWMTSVVNVSDGTIRPVPGIPENATNPDWSPAGNQIVYSHYTDPSRQIRDLYVINTDGSGLVQLTNTPAIGEDEPIWSPDGQKIVFTAYEDQERGEINKDIYIMNRDGTGVTRVTTDPGGDFDPSWSPDGKQIVFVSGRHENNDSNYEIYVIDVDGSNELRLTNNRSTDRWPTWRAPKPEDVVAADCQPALELVADVTIPAGTRFAAPQPFSKVWRLKNSGSCAWTPTDYLFRFAEGEQMGDVIQVLMPGAVQPGATLDLVLPQVAPDAAGRHVARWQLVKRDGTPVPGADGSPVTLAVDLEVLEPGQTVLPKPLYFLSNQSGSPQIWRMETDARKVTQITNESQSIDAMAVSAAGKVAYITQAQLILTDAAGADRQVIASLPADVRLRALAWSRDGNQLAYGSHGIRLFTASTGEDRLLLADTETQDPNLVHYQPLEWSPDGSKLMTSAHLWESGLIRIISTGDGSVLVDLPWQATTAWNQDNQSVYLASAQFPCWSCIEQGLWRGPAAGGEPQPLIAQAAVWSPVQRPDGTLAFFMYPLADPEAAEFAAQLYVSSSEGQDPVAVRSWPLLISANDTFDAFWTEDGQTVLVHLVRPALDVSEVMLLSANEDPPLFLTSAISKLPSQQITNRQISNFVWGP